MGNSLPLSIDRSALRGGALTMLDASDILKEVYLPGLREFLTSTSDGSKMHICSYYTRPRVLKEGGNCPGCGAPA